MKSDRSSCHRFAANQFRLFVHSPAYVLLHAMRNSLFRGTEWAIANTQTIQLKILKIGDKVRQLKTMIKAKLPSFPPAGNDTESLCHIPNIALLKHLAGGLIVAISG